MQQRKPAKYSPRWCCRTMNPPRRTVARPLACILNPFVVALQSRPSAPPRPLILHRAGILRARPSLPRRAHSSPRARPRRSGRARRARRPCRPHSAPPTSVLALVSALPVSGQPPASTLAIAQPIRRQWATRRAAALPPHETAGRPAVWRPRVHRRVLVARWAHGAAVARVVIAQRGGAWARAIAARAVARVWPEVVAAAEAAPGPVVVACVARALARALALAAAVAWCLRASRRPFVPRVSLWRAVFAP